MVNIGGKNGSAVFSTFEGRDVSLEAKIRFWRIILNGHATAYSSKMLWRTSKYFNIQIKYEKNLVDLPGGSFKTDLIGL